MPHKELANTAPKRLILGFDGTGNSFLGTSADTNIVKLMDMFDRSSPNQMHYYQPGIGTYSTSGSVNQGFFGRINRSISQTLDSAIATSFDAHVIAGYRFLMRYYGMGDRIYIFGFSRGAFTARFLARMIFAVGLLSMGNEEMVPFAYKVYQDYEMSKPTSKHATAYMNTFRSAFCRHEGKKIGIKVHFLGLFDTVNSVGTFDVGMTGKMKAPGVVGTAYHVRHAVAIDERRVKFKAALLAQDKRSDHCKDEVSKEVWFPGNHGDIGGGWPAETQPKENLGFWERIKRAWVGLKDSKEPHVDKTDDDFQLSDNALKWMIDELEDIEYPNGDEGLRWNSNKKDFIDRIQQESHRSQAINGRMHDTMSFGGGSSFWKTLLWRLMDYLPFFRRWELIDGEWKTQRFPPNMGGTRDIPPTALFHHSVKERMLQFPDKYHPRNDIDGQGSLHLNDATQNAGRRKLYFEAENKQAKRANGDPVQEHDRVYKLVFK